MTDEPCTEINCAAQMHPASEGHIDGPDELERLRAEVAELRALVTGRPPTFGPTSPALHPAPVLTDKNPYPMCICLRCGPPFRNQVADWREQFHGPFGGASWMALCPTCGNKRCPGAMDHAKHEADA